MRKIFTAALLMTLISGGLSYGQEETPVLIPTGPHAAERYQAKKSGAHEVTMRGRIQSPAKASESPLSQVTDIIYEVEGKSQLCSKASEGVYPFGEYYLYSQEAAPATIVYGNNDDIYFLDILEYGVPSYTKGVIKGDNLVVSLPQTLMVDNYEWLEENLYYNLCVLQQMNYSDGIWFEPREDISEVVYMIDPEDGSLTLTLPEEEDATLVLGLCMVAEGYEADWGEYCDYSQKFTPFHDEIATMPEGVEQTQYQFIMENGYGFPVAVAETEEALYIQGLSSYEPSLTVKAVFEEGYPNLVKIPTGQYIGIYEYENAFMIAKFGFLYSETESYSLMVQAPETIDFYMVIDTAQKIIYPSINNMILCFCYAGYDFLASEAFYNFELKYQEDMMGVPSNPYNLEWIDEYFNVAEPYYFRFNIDAIGTQGQLLDTDTLFYRILVNDEELEFTAGYPYDYSYLYTDHTILLPYWFSNGYDIFAFYSEPTKREIGIYIDGVSTVGVQSIYLYNDVETCSDIVTLDVETGEVNQTRSASASFEGVADVEVISTEYYDLNGRRISNPGKGVFITKSIMNDGSKQVTKRIF